MICPECHAANDDHAHACSTCGRFLGLPGVGALLAGRCEIRGVLGQGGMGIVYRAFDRVLDEVVAIKVLRPDVEQDAEAARRFRSEIKLARRVSHRNVCRIHEYNEDHGLRYISMEFVDGQDLRQILRQSGLPGHREAVDILVQLGQGLIAIHEVGIIHRDLKARNVMRDSRGVVRLMDFGIAKQSGADTLLGVTAAGMIVGTPEYMSPEQARGEKLDFRSDIYSFGVLMFELFAGDVPFRGDTPLDTMRKHCRDPLPLDQPAAAAIPAALRPVLRQALAKEPGQRFRNVEDMVSALTAAARVALAPAPSAPGPRSQRKVRWVGLPTVRQQVGTRPPTAATPSHVRTVFAFAGWIVLGAAAIAVLGRQLTRSPQGVPSPPVAETRGVHLALTTPTPAAAPPSFGQVAIRHSTGTRTPPSASSAGPTRLVPVKGDIRSPPNEATLPPSPAIADTRPGVLAIRSTPQATVLVDGVLRGRTPLAIEGISPGRHTLVATADDGRRLERAIEVQPGAAIEEHIRFPGFGSLSVVSPVWYEVSVDGGPPRQTPCQFNRVMAGHHTVRATRPGYSERVFDVEVQEGDTRILEVTLTREPASR